MNKSIVDKDETVAQWTKDPCGLIGGEEFSVGSKEFFEAIDRDRYEKYAPWLKTAIDFPKYKGKKVLEVGFGMGTDLFQFSKGGATVTGVDLVPRHFEIAKKRFSLFQQECQIQNADVESLPFENEKFDVCYSFGVLHHTPNISKAFDEIYRILKPGGEVVIAVYHQRSAFFVFCILLPYLLFRFMRESYRQTLARIEYQSERSAVPLVNVYSKKKISNIMRMFKIESLECHHLEKGHFGFLRWFLPERVVQWMTPYLGWYLVVKGRK